MTIEQIKSKVVAFVADMGNSGAAPEDTLTAVDLLISSTLKATPSYARAKVADIFFNTIKENI